MLSEKVIWSEGMLLRPQHFQQQDRYFMGQLRRQAAVFCHHPWGFREFQIDEQYLALGKLVLSKASGVFQDGVIFEADPSRNPLALDIPPGLTDQTVFLTLPMAPEGSVEAAAEGERGLAARYLSHEAEVPDSNAGQTQRVVIRCGTLNLKLMLEGELNREGCLAMPVARLVESRPDRSLVLDRDFWPSFLRLGASEAMSGYLREVIGLISYRGDQLALRVGGAGQTGAAEIADFLLLQCVNRNEPLFRQMAETPNLHPEEFHLRMLALVGELATFVRPGKRPAEMPFYDHSRQNVILNAVMEQVREALSMVLEQHSVELPLQARQYGVLAAPLFDRSLLGSAAFVLSAQADMEAEVLSALLPKQLKIGPVENIRQLVNLHLPGIRLRALPVAPRQIPFHAGKHYFKLEMNPEELGRMENSGGFAFHVSGDFPGLQLQLWAIKE